MENEFLSVSVSPKGAELTSIRDKRTGFEYLWQADPAVWARHAPVLFPIVGKVKNNMLIAHDTSYPMSQHGFARDQIFNILSETTNACTYQLSSNDATLALFPFPFTLQLGYELDQNTIHCHYKIINTGSKPLYFSIGAHPGFNLPEPDLSLYEIRFNQSEATERRLLSDGLLNGSSKPVLSSPTHIQLSKELFNDDAIVFDNLNSDTLWLKQLEGKFEIQLKYSGFPYMGIWTQKNCERYICLEPWCGIADNTGGHDDIAVKAGINMLEAGGIFERTYSLTFSS